MAINKTPTTLGRIDFSDIKTNLTNFLKNQSTFSGYNFEGSAMQSLIDLLAYNSFYYAYYANMINAEAFLDSAQKEDSIISLTKPLGYTVPSRTAAKAYVRASGFPNDNDISEGTIFTSTNANGVQFTFFNLDRVPVVNGISDPFYIYEGTQYINRVDFLPFFDYDNQKISIADTDFDISTLRVFVTEKIDGGSSQATNEWTKVSNIGYVSQVNQNIYFVERTSTGFMILFSLGNEVGRIIDDNITKIEITYLKTNGSAGNNLLNFRNSTIGGNIVIQTERQSSGGRDKPDLEKVRKLAPIWFSSQERAVTVNDYKALLIDAGFFENDSEFNVFGGQDLSPPRYGRVFITSNLEQTNEKVLELTDFIKSRSVITIYPEYVVSNTLNVYSDFTFRYNDNNTSNRTFVLSTVKSIFKNKYAQFGKYNVNFSASNFIEDITTNTEYDTRVNEIQLTPDDFTHYVEELLSPGQEYTFNLQNELQLPLNTFVNITTNFSLNRSIPNIPLNVVNGVLRMYITTVSQRNQNISLHLYAVDSSGAPTTLISRDFGYFNVNQGVIYIPDGVIDSNSTFKVNFAKKNFTIGLNNLITYNYKNISMS